MQLAIDNFQRKVFIFLLYLSACSGVISDIVMDGNRTIFYGTFDVLMILLGLMSLSFAGPRLLYILLFLIGCFVFNLTYSPVSVYSSLNGMREILAIVGMVLFYNKIFSEQKRELTEEYIDIIRKFAYIFLILQIPVAFAQWLKYGPSDFVGGTLGAWCSGVLSLTLVSLVYFLHFYSRNISVNIMLYVTLIPMFLNETKISFILIPMMFVFVYFQLKLKNVLIGVGGAMVFFVLFNHFYSASYLDFDDSAAGIFSADFLSDYLMADIYTYSDIPRVTKIILAWNLLVQEMNTFFFGFEYGLFKGGKVMTTSTFYQTYRWMLVGTRPYLFFLMMQGGVMLVIGFLWMVTYVNNYFKNMNKFKVFLLIILLLMFLYNDAMRNQHFVIIYFFLAFYASSDFYDENAKII